MSSVSSRASTASVKSRLDQVLSSPSYSKAGRSMKKLMKSASAIERNQSSDKDDGSDSILTLGSGKNETLMNDIKQSVLEKELWDAENNAAKNLLSPGQDGCIESKGQIYIPRKLGAEKKHGISDDNDIDTALDIGSIRNSRDGRRDDAFVSSPRSMDSSRMEGRKNIVGDDINTINERRQAQFLERTEAGRKILQSYIEKQEKAKNERSRASPAPQNQTSTSNGPAGKKDTNSFYFKTTPRKDLSMKSDAPPIGRYFPVYRLIEERPRSVLMGNAPRPKTLDHSLQSPTSTGRSKSARSHFSGTARSMDSKLQSPKSGRGANEVPLPQATPTPMESSQLQPEAEKLTKKQKKEQKRYQDQVNSWIESRFVKKAPVGLSTMRSVTPQTNISSTIKLNDLTYWPDSDPVRHMEKSKVLINMNMDCGRNETGVRPMVLDPVYSPNHDIKFTRTTIGNHVMEKQCDRDAQLRTLRIGIEAESDSRTKNDIGLHKFYNVDSPKEKFVYRRNQANLDIDKIVGREDPRNNYLLDTQKKALKTKGTALGGFEPLDVLSNTEKLVQNVSFSKQIERKFQPGFNIHDLDYNPDLNPVKERITYTMDFDATTERKFQPGFVMNDLMYFPKLDSSSRINRPVTLVNMDKNTTRSNNISAMLSRTASLDPPVDLEYENSSEQQLKLESRVTGNPFLGKQIGRSELDRLAKRLRGTTDVFYDVEPHVYDVVAPREIRSANYDMQKVTNRYEKFENTMTKDSISQNRPVGGKQVEVPFVVRGKGGIVLNDLTYNPKFDLVEERPITHKIV